MQLDKTALLNVWDNVSHVAKQTDAHTLYFTNQDICAFNDTMLIACPFETDFSGSLNALELIHLLKKTKTAHIDVTETNNQLHVKTPRMTAHVAFDPASEVIPIINTITDHIDAIDSWHTLTDPKSFKIGLSTCLKSTHKQLDHVMNCVHVTKNNLVSTDDFRISKYVLTDTFEKDMLISRAIGTVLTQFSCDHVAYTDDWVCFLQPDDTLVAFRHVIHDFLDVDPRLEFEGTTYDLPDDLKEKIDCVSVMAGDNATFDRVITVTLSHKKIELTARKDLGWAKIKCDAPKITLKKPISFMIHPQFLSDVLPDTSPKISIGDNKILFTKDNVFYHLIAMCYV